jgi:cupin fold WbuC family metalloprotein
VTDTFFCGQASSACDSRTVEFLKRAAASSPKHSARLCMHRSPDDPTHEMLIALSRDIVVRPHRHVGKSESYHIVEGALDLIVFDDAGEPESVVSLATPEHGLAFHHRLNEPKWHSLIVKTAFAVFVETTTGPFVPGRAEYADFAPAEGPELKAFLADCAARGLAACRVPDTLAFLADRADLVEPGR